MIFQSSSSIYRLYQYPFIYSHPPRPLKIWLLTLQGGGVPLQLTPLNLAPKIQFSPWGCMFTQCTPDYIYERQYIPPSHQPIISVISYLRVTLHFSIRLAHTTDRPTPAPLKLRPNGAIQMLLLVLFLIPSGVKIPRVKSKVKSKTRSWSGHSSSLEKLLWSKIELKRCALNSDRNALEKKAGLSVVSWNRRHLAAELRKESDRWLIQRAKCLCYHLFIYLFILFINFVSLKTHRCVARQKTVAIAVLS